MNVNITGKTSLYGIIGHPVRHSLSPVMQNEAFLKAGLDAIYVPFEVHPDQLERAISGLQALGVLGFNVTIPHKTSVIPLLSRLDESAQSAGAVNTVKLTAEGLIGYNTDGDGLVRSLLLDCFFSPAGKRVVMYGAGGAARGAAAALCRAGVSSIGIINRTESIACDLISALASRYGSTSFSVLDSNDDIHSAISDADLLLNTTSLGMKQETLPRLSLDKMQSSAIVYDMVYSPPRTPLLQQAEQRGLRCANGLGMLACQGELGFELWTGALPAQGQMRRALEVVCSV